MKTNSDWKSALGARVLITTAKPDDSPAKAHEAFVAEIAKGSGYVRLDPFGWFAPDHWAIIEQLSPSTELEDVADLKTLRANHAAALEAIAARTKDANDAVANYEAERVAHDRTKEGLNRHRGRAEQLEQDLNDAILRHDAEHRAHVATAAKLDQLVTHANDVEGQLAAEKTAHAAVRDELDALRAAGQKDPPAGKGTAAASPLPDTGTAIATPPPAG